MKLGAATSSVTAPKVVSSRCNPDPALLPKAGNESYGGENSDSRPGGHRVFDLDHRLCRMLGSRHRCQLSVRQRAGRRRHPANRSDRHECPGRHRVALPARRRRRNDLVCGVLPRRSLTRDTNPRLVATRPLECTVGFSLLTSHHDGAAIARLSVPLDGFGRFTPPSRANVAATTGWICADESRRSQPQPPASLIGRFCAPMRAFISEFCQGDSVVFVHT